MSATDEIQFLRQRISQLEQELSVVRRDHHAIVPRLPSLRSIVQADLGDTAGPPCPTCGQPRPAPPLSTEPNRTYEVPVPSIPQPVSNSTRSEVDPLTVNNVSYLPVKNPRCTNH